MRFGRSAWARLWGRWARNAVLCALVIFACSGALADTAAFDLIGPRIEMRVTRAGLTLPISQVPNLRPGDRLWIQAEFPADQSVRYLLVVGFLQGPTNPPPVQWFTEADTWDKRFRQEGMVVTVPRRARQALLLLAPETGGGYAAVRNAVRGKPGVFVRAARDLNRAGLEKARLDTYLGDLRATSQTDPQALHQRSALLARTLSVKLDQDCFNQPVDQQESCLVQGNDQLLRQENNPSMVASLTSGPSADLIGAVSSTPIARSGYYSPYVGSVVDLVRLMGRLRSPHYEYIPALTVPSDDDLNLRLNAPPSFHDPKSVLVVGLPPVGPAQAPAMRPVDPRQVYCLDKGSVVLPVAGAPLAFATKLGHDFFLRLKDKSGRDVRLPAVADATRGGFLVDTSSLHRGQTAASLDGTIQGTWGFQPFTGPTFHFRAAEPTHWAITRAERAALVVGRVDTLDLHSSAAVCVQSVAMQYASATPVTLGWNATPPDEVKVTLPLKGESPGPFRLLIAQYGLTKPDAIELRAYANEAKLDHFRIHAGDARGVLTGARLDEVASLELSGIHFVAGDLSRPGRDGELRLSVGNPSSAAALHGGAHLIAHVTLKDGRVLDLPTTIEPPRPKVMLESVSVASGPVGSYLRLGKSHELPQNGSVVFALKSEIPAEFPRTEKIEVATADGSSDVLLSVDRGNLIVQDAQSLLATLDPRKAFGPSAYGPLRFRPVSVDGSKGDWQPLATLVRTPSLKEVHCPPSAGQPCTLTGQDLYLVDSISSDPSFAHSVSVPLGYAAPHLSVPRPDGTLLYIKLRDDPTTVDTLSLPVLPQAR